MKKRNIFTNLKKVHLICAPFFLCFLMGAKQTAEPESTTEPESMVLSENNNATLRIAYADEDLVNFINAIAAAKQINIILPSGANALKLKLNFTLDKEISLEDAWNRLSNILTAADYRIVKKENNYAIIKNTKDSKKEPTSDLYINSAPDTLPDNDEFIRYLYYFSNIKLSFEGDNELDKVLKQLLPDNTIIQADPSSNCVILAAPSRVLRAAIRIIQALDLPGMLEKMDIVKLKHSSADTVANIFNEGILKQADDFNRYRLDSKKKSDTAYFSRNLRVVPDMRSNAVVILGKSSAVDRVKQFIQKYIDIELDSGKSVVHIYQLQYQNAEEFAPILRKIVESNRGGGTEQSRTGASLGGPFKTFDEVIIKSDRPDDPEKTKYYGGNNLIIVARNDDWKVIEKIIKDLDRPKRLIFIEILIADMSIDDTRRLGSLTRNPARLVMPGSINFQSLHTGSPLKPSTGAITTDANTKTIGIIDSPERAVADLLALKSTSSSDGKTTNDPQNISAKPGTTTIAISDSEGETWSILNLLKVFNHSKVLSHPHIIVTPNKEAIIKSGEERLLEGQIVENENNNQYRKQEKVPAETVIKLTARINSNNQTEDLNDASINLDIEVNIDEFKNEKGDKDTRKVITNTNVKNNSILALGGLIRTKSDQGQSETPGLGRIPIIGWFFKGRNQEQIKTNLTIFIRPTILDPKSKPILNTATNDYIAMARLYGNEGALFDSLRDPITRWFFGKDTDLDTSIDSFIVNKHLPPEKTIVKPQVTSNKVSLNKLLKNKKNPFIKS